MCALQWDVHPVPALYHRETKPLQASILQCDDEEKSYHPITAIIHSCLPSVWIFHQVCTQSTVCIRNWRRSIPLSSVCECVFYLSSRRGLAFLSAVSTLTISSSSSPPVYPEPQPRTRARSLPVPSGKRPTLGGD